MKDDTMAEFDVYTLEGKKDSTLSASDAVFNTTINRGLMHLAVLWYLANARSGTHSTLTKGEVTGGGKKPYQQKHTGRARRGSSRTPLIVGGGVAFGPKPRSYGFDLTKKMKKVALRSALSNKKGNTIILASTELKSPKTKEVQGFLNALKLEANALIVADKPSKNFVLAGRNISALKTIDVKNINVYEVLKYNTLILTKEAVRKLEESLA
jgi:large subunit ribosomal protein L4